MEIFPSTNQSSHPHWRSKQPTASSDRACLIPQGPRERMSLELRYGETDLITRNPGFWTLPSEIKFPFILVMGHFLSVITIKTRNPGMWFKKLRLIILFVRFCSLSLNLPCFSIVLHNLDRFLNSGCQLYFSFNIFQIFFIQNPLLLLLLLLLLLSLLVILHLSYRRTSCNIIFSVYRPLVNLWLTDEILASQRLRTNCISL